MVHSILHMVVLLCCMLSHTLLDVSMVRGRDTILSEFSGIISRSRYLYGPRGIGFIVKIHG